MAYARICVRVLDDPVDEVHAAGRDRHARAADAAKDDDLFHAGHDAVGHVVGTVGTFAILVFRQYRQLWPADGHQPDEQAEHAAGTPRSSIRSRKGAKKVKPKFERPS